MVCWALNNGDDMAGDNIIFDQCYILEKFIELRERTGFQNNLELAKAYVKKYPIDTRHTKGWYEYIDPKIVDGKEVKDYDYRALGIKENEKGCIYYLIEDSFDNEEEAIKAVKDSFKQIDSTLTVKKDLLDVMVLYFHKHRIYRGGNNMKNKTDLLVENNMIEIYDEEIQIKFSEQVAEQLDALENLHNTNHLVAKGYVNSEEYHNHGQTLRNQIIDKYVQELNNFKDPFEIKDGSVTFQEHDKKISKKERKKPNLERFIQSTTIDMTLCAAVIDYLSGLNTGTESAAEVLSNSHEWRKEKGLETGDLRKSLINEEKIGGNISGSLKSIVQVMIENQFDIQPLFNENKRCVGCLELNSLSKHMSVHGYNKIGDEINIIKLNEEGLISRPPVIIDAISELHWFGRLLGDGLDAVLFRWEPAENHLHDELNKYKSPKLEPGLHIITSHDILAYVDYKENY